MEHDFPVVESVEVADVIQLLPISLAIPFTEERRQWLAGEETRLDAEHPTRRHVGFADVAVYVGDEIGVGRRVEQLTVHQPLAVDCLTTGSERFVLGAEPLFGEA